MSVFESEIGEPLPMDFREFLFMVNGGIPENKAFSYGDGRSFCVRRFFPLKSTDPPPFDLRRQNLNYKDAPDDLLIIGFSTFGDTLCIGLRGSHRGKLFWIDHEERDPDKVEENEWLGVRPLADSFSAFIGALEKI